MFGVGEFSRITGLTVKTLRFYHEKSLLTPARVDAGSGYRHYDDRNVETARAIVSLRDLGFSLDEIAAILGDCADESDMLEFLERRKQALRDRVARDRETVAAIDQIIHRELEARQIMQTTAFQVEEKTLPPLLVAGVRMKGRYHEMGQGFSQIARRLGRHIAGKCLCLYYDGEYMEEDADFEPCMPIKRRVEAEGISVRELPGGKCVSLLHRGPYDDLKRSYQQLLKHLDAHGYEALLPTREVYLKGPGMIFRGNPKKYLTEIQMLVRPKSKGALPSAE